MAQRKGFRDVYIAEIEYDPIKLSYVAQTPVQLFNAISGKTKLTYKSEETYADDTLFTKDRDYEKGEIELEGINLTPQNLELIYGHKYVKGMTVTSANDPNKYVAVGFRSKNTDGTYHFYWYYLVSFSNEEEADFETIAEKSKKQTIKLKGEILRRPDGNIGVDIDESALTGEDTEAKALLEVDNEKHIIKWFTKVQEPLTNSVE